MGKSSVSRASQREISEDIGCRAPFHRSKGLLVGAIAFAVLSGVALAVAYKFGGHGSFLDKLKHVAPFAGPVIGIGSLAAAYIGGKDRKSVQKNSSPKISEKNSPVQKMQLGPLPNDKTPEYFYVNKDGSQIWKAETALRLPEVDEQTGPVYNGL